MKAWTICGAEYFITLAHQHVPELGGCPLHLDGRSAIDAVQVQAAASPNGESKQDRKSPLPQSA